MAHPRRLILSLIAVSGLLSAMSLPVAAQSPELLADIDQTPRNWAYGDLAFVGGKVVVEASEPYGFTQIVAIDPATGRHQQLLPNNQLGEVFLKHGDKLFSKDRTSDEGTFYVTDGTFVGTDSLGTLPGEIVSDSTAVANGRLFFWTDTNGGWQLFATDGTDLERLTADPAGQSARPDRVIATDAGVLFVTPGCEITFSDGTSAGTQALFTVPETTFEGRQQECRIFEGPGDRFIVNSEPYLVERAWLSDGTLEGTERADHLSLIEETRRVGGSLFYLTGDDLWVTDGTEAGSTMLGSPGARTRLYALNGALVAFTEDYALLRSDGTTAGTEELATGLDPLLEAQVVDDQWLYLMTDGGAIRRTDGTSAGTDRNVANTMNSGSRVSSFAATADAVVIRRDDDLVHLDLSTDETTTIWPEEEQVYTVGSSPRVFVTVGQNVFFNAAGDYWVTRGIPGEVSVEPLLDYSTEFYGVVGDGLMLARLNGEFVTVEDGDISNARPLDDSKSDRDHEPDEAFILETRVFVRDGVAFVVDLTNFFPEDEPPVRRLVISTAGPDAIETVLMLRWPEEIDPTSRWNAWIDLDGNLEIQMESDCSRWLIDGTGEILTSEDGAGPDQCQKVHPTQLGNVVLEVDRLGLYATLGDQRRRLVDSLGLSTFTEPLVVGEYAYWVMLEERRAELWRTDGTIDGTEFISRGLSQTNRSPVGGLVQAGDAVLFAADEGSEGEMAIRGHRATGGKFSITPLEGNGRLADGDRADGSFAVLGDKIVYNGAHATLGQEPFVIEFERAELPETPVDEDPDDDPAADDGNEQGDIVMDGCGCGSAPAGAPGGILLLIVALFGSRIRRRSAHAFDAARRG